MNNTQSRPGAKVLASLVIVLGMSIGVVGCSGEHPAPSGPSTSGETSSSVTAQNMVDVEQVWAEHPMPDCPRVVIGNQSAPAGLGLPSDETVAEQLQGVRSPGSDAWVREKLGWIAKHLSQTRADIIDAYSPGDDSMLKTFNSYVKHVRVELQAGKDSSDPTDAIYPDGCA
ncbi:hypothetical protein [Mycobacteroides abscessus]|uniref:hypothetical protein n=1 Tax=Mycobacteroides abscessus TaxID=36809 RepID=UPI0009C99489|nr:hypothetical protein [Mycobacteroides abscessus]SLF09217.1 Uncharacterised protein [Mycobacteroides abscessus subsp. massiliense]